MKTTHTLKNLSLIIIMFLCHFQAKAQISSEFYGITSSSGEQKLFRTDSIGQNTETVMEFKDYYGENGTAGLVDNGSGRMFGLTVDGGTGNLAVGGLYEFQVLSDEFNLLVEFDTVPGDYPRGKLVLNNTDLYGVTSQGGANNVGVLFVYNYVSGVYTKLHDFAATTGGVPESGMILNNQGNLMGMTYYGGANNQGVIYEYNLTTNTYQVIHSFDGANGANPVGRLLSASNGKYYGLTFNGGTSNNGVAFSL
ncbi:MAG: choice-of-anchor tandem repeat GloVer-containing protein, partial [Crocinitomicaceae bacterium]